MRYLLAPVVLVALLFAAPAYAETIEMECEKANDVDLTHFKYENPLIGEAKMFGRLDGKWGQAALARVSERSAVIEETRDNVADQDWPGSNVKKGDEWQLHVKWVYDFAFFQYTYTFYRTKMDGSPQIPGRVGHDRAKPEVKERLCKKPDESWEDRKNR